MSGISRRKFLTCTLVGAGATALSLKTTDAFASAKLEGYPDSMGVLVDLGRCVGCRSCEAACNREQNLPDPALSFDDQSVFDQTFHNGQKRRTDENAYTVVNRYEPDGTEQAGLPQDSVQPLQRAGLPDLMLRQCLYQDAGRRRHLQPQDLRRLSQLHDRLPVQHAGLQLQQRHQSGRSRSASSATTPASRTASRRPASKSAPSRS